MVRERAFCGVAMSGTPLLAERYVAVPRLLAIVEDRTQDRQTLAWAYQALREISSQYDLPEEPGQWRVRLSNTGFALSGRGPAVGAVLLQVELLLADAHTRRASESCDQFRLDTV